MIGKGLGRPFGRLVLGLTVLGTGGAGVGSAQGMKAATGRAGASKPAAAPAPAPGDQDFRMETRVIPVNPTDPIAKVNGEVITRQELADECVARKGEEILDTLIARRLIEQAIKARNLTVTAGEIDEEIDRAARTMAGISREAWLRTLHKERGISPVQYARDIIYPAIALRKLAEPRVVITEDDLKQTFASSFGDKLRCRIILVNKLQNGTAIWEELRKDPDRFEAIAKNDPRSIDEGTRSLGGLLAEPIRRYAQPRTVSDAAFHDLVDGDGKDNDPSRKPKDGDISGVIQVAESTWVIMKRESLEPAEKRDMSDPALRARLTEAVKESKMKDEMVKVYEELAKASAIENRLVGREKMAHEERDPAHQVDGQVKLTSDPNAAVPPRPGATKAAGSVAHPPTPKMAPPQGK